MHECLLLGALNARYYALRQRNASRRRNKRLISRVLFQVDLRVHRLMSSDEQQGGIRRIPYRFGDNEIW